MLAFWSNCLDEILNDLKLQLHDAIYRLRFYSNSLTHILSLSNSHNVVALIRKNRGDKSHSVIVAWVDSLFFLARFLKPHLKLVSGGFFCNLYWLFFEWTDYSVFLCIHLEPGVPQSTNWPILRERNAICFLSYVTKAASLHQFTVTMSNYNCRPLSRRDTQLNHHYTLHMNSLKDH